MLCHQAGGDSSKDDDHQSTAVISATTDEFVLGQDMCMSCGSYGSGEEGQLIVCVQCGQCYHPYCANMKVGELNIVTCGMVLLSGQSTGLSVERIWAGVHLLPFCNLANFVHPTLPVFQKRC